MVSTCLKGLVIAFYEVRCKNHRTTKFLEADKQLAAHGINGLLRALGDFSKPPGEQRIGFIDKKKRLITLGRMENRLDIFRSLPMNRAFDVPLLGNQMS